MIALIWFTYVYCLPGRRVQCPTTYHKESDA